MKAEKGWKMKKGLIALSFLCISTLNYADTELQSEYSQAILKYKEGDFAASYEKLSTLYLSNLSDVKLNFYLGRSAYETGHYEIALAAFERVQMLQPSNIRNRLAMARTYFMLKMYEDAQIAFKEVLANPNIPENVRKNIELYLAKTQKVQQKSFTYANINLDILYDSNVNYGSLESQYNVSGGILPATEGVSDGALELYGDLTNIYDIGEKNGFSIKNCVVGYVKKYFKEKDYNMQYISYTPSIVYLRSSSKLEVALGFDDLFIGKENYMQSLSLTPSYEYTHTSTLKSAAYFKYKRKNFQQESEQDLDANHYELSYALQKILSPRSYVQGTLTGINESKVHGERVDVDYMEYKVGLSYAKQFTSTYAAKIFAEYRKRKYSDYSPLFDSTRDDDGRKVMATLNAKVYQTVQLHLKAVYSGVESNQERYSYEKYTMMLGLNKTF